MRILKFFIFLLSFSALSQNSLLSKSQENNFKSQVIDKANEINSFSADFTQTKYMKMMDENPESQGKVFYKSPDMLKWEYTKPYDYEVLFKNTKLFIMEDGELSEVDLSSNKLFEKMGELVAGSVNGKILKADKDFTITYLTEKNNIKAKIVPKDKSLSSMFQEIWINFNKDHLIKSIRLIDPSGDYTEILMKNIKINQTIPPSVFQN